VRAQLGEFSFLVFRKALEKFPAYHETQYCVPQKFHLLVIGSRNRNAAGSTLRLQFTCIGSVSDGLLQESASPEAMPESFFQRGEVMRVGVHLRSMARETAEKATFGWYGRSEIVLQPRIGLPRWKEATKIERA
jgi:hypothetical protein